MTDPGSAQVRSCLSHKHVAQGIHAVAAGMHLVACMLQQAGQHDYLTCGCAGQRFGLQEAKLALVHLCRTYSFR